MTDEVLLVGVGVMGCAYAEAITALGYQVTAVGRSAAAARHFEEVIGVRPAIGGLTSWVDRGSAIPPTAIVCVTIDETANTTKQLLRAGVKRILVEKPGGTTPQEIVDLAAAAAAANARVFVGYNRRYYASVLEAERRIGREGGVKSFHFEFTERERDAASPKFSAAAKRFWVLANSSHVIDLAFFLGGEPSHIHGETAGALDWHPTSSQFVGCGRSRSGALFSYCANWCSGGRWGVEVMTDSSRLILRPLEKLWVQHRGTFDQQEVDLAIDHDTKFKPGIFRQTEAFLHDEQPCRLMTIAEQAQRAVSVYPIISAERESIGALP